MKTITRRSIALRAASLLMSTVLLTACATSGQSDLEYGRALLASGRLKEAHSTLERAHRQAPGNAELRATYLSANERLGNFLLAQGDEALKQQRWPDAEQAYRQAAALTGFEARAAEGQKKLQDAQAAVTQAAAPAALPPSSHSSHANPVPSPVVTASAPTLAASAPVGRPLPAAGLPSMAVPPATRATPPRPAAKPARATARKEAPQGPSLEAPSADHIAQAMKRRVTLQFRDASVRTVFDVIAKTSGLNIIIDKDIPPELKTTVYLNNTTIESAIKKVLMTSQLAYREMDENTLFIYPDQIEKRQDYQNLVVKSFYLTNADARVVANSLRTVLKFRDVMVDQKLNMLVMRDTPEAIRLAEQLVTLHDMPEPEVMLELEVLEIGRSYLENLGINWPGQITLAPLPIQLQGATPSYSAQSAPPVTLREITSANRNTIGVSGVSLSVQANRESGDVKTLANPRIRVKNREKARVLIGQKVPVFTSSANGSNFVSATVQYLDVGLKLDAEPQIYADNEIVIRLGLEVSSIIREVENQKGTQAAAKAYIIGARTANTVLRLKDGETQVLGGLIQDEDRKGNAAIPGLGDIPILGKLFGARSDEKNKTEIVLSITPRLVRGIQRPPANVGQFEAGTYSGVRGRGQHGAPDGGINPGDPGGMVDGRMSGPGQEGFQQQPQQQPQQQLPGFNNNNRDQ